MPAHCQPCQSQLRLSALRLEDVRNHRAAGSVALWQGFWRAGRAVGARCHVRAARHCKGAASTNMVSRDLHLDEAPWRTSRSVELLRGASVRSPTGTRHHHVVAVLR